MFKLKKIIFFLLLISFSQFSFAQMNLKREDSTKMYRDIEKYSEKRRFTRFLHKLIFEPISKAKSKNPLEIIPLKKKQNPANYEGKVIRKINIATFDPFGYSENDSVLHPNNRISKFGNSLHIKTRKLAIRNLLLIKRNTPLDSLLVKESERLIRSQRYVRTVTINSEIVSQDSVDVYIRVLDSWSIVPDFSTSGSRSTFRLTDRNFLGSGHEFASAYQKSHSTNQSAYSTSYSIPNILQTFIKTQISYQSDLDGYYNKFTNIERPFFSPLARWAGGIYFNQQFRREFKSDAPSLLVIQNTKFDSQDFWAGYSFQIFKGNSEVKRSTNLITTARYFNRNYLEIPLFEYDRFGVFSSERLYLTSIGISSRKFTQDKFLFNYNVIEDIPSGFVYNITAGYQEKNLDNRYYVGGRFALGNYYKFGYLSTNIEYGTFFKNAVLQQNAFVFNTIFFTNLLEMGKWKFRQFVKTEFIIGNNRFDSNADKLTLNRDNGIQGFNNTLVFGTKKFLATFQIQSYSPRNVYGFRLNPFLNYTMGMLGNATNGFKTSRLYSQLGLGLIITNDYLVFSSFQISFSYFPSIPGDGNSIFKTNAFQTGDFGLQNFEIAKPLLVPYQ